MLQANQIIRMHDESTQQWHDGSAHQELGAASPTDVGQPSILKLVLEQHRANYELWHQEDEARNPKASDATITAVKHEIDRLNQRRNDLVEKIDVILFACTRPQNMSAPLHSETPGLMIDRLSIMALKRYHTYEEFSRDSASAEHRFRNQARLELLSQQRGDLALCLDRLWAEVLAGTRQFKLYRQMKMYNDPELNPVLYRGSQQDEQGD